MKKINFAYSKQQDFAITRHRFCDLIQLCWVVESCMDKQLCSRLDAKERGET